MKKTMIASRANAANANMRFYKSYVKNIRLAETREIPDHRAGLKEEDYLFTYKDKEYRINQHIKSNKKGNIEYSAAYEYTLKEN